MFLSIDTFINCGMMCVFQKSCFICVAFEKLGNCYYKISWNNNGLILLNRLVIKSQ